MFPSNIQDALIFHLNQIDFHRWWALWLLPLLLPLAWGLYAWQRYTLTNVRPAFCAILAGLRVLILALLFLYLAAPYRKAAEPPPQKAVVAVLFDHSGSMELPAAPFESDEALTKIAAAAGYPVKDGVLDSETRKSLNRVGRSKLAQTVLAHTTVTGADGKPSPLAESLSRKFDVRYYSFSSELKQLGVNPAKPELPDPPHPGGDSTRIGDALDKLRSDLTRRKTAGVLLFSDGRNTAGRSPSEVGADCGAANVPVFPVPVGPTQLHYVSVVAADARGQVSVGDQVTVSATIESQGFDQRVVKVELKDGDKPLDSKEVALSGAEQQHVDLTFKADKAGARYLTVSVPPQPEEPDYLHDANSRPVCVSISDEKFKVLYLEGLPRWDYRYLKNDMRRDNGLTGRTGKEPDIVLEAEWRRLSDSERRDALPRTLDQLAEYHTIILGDVSPKMLDSAFVDLLLQAVRERGVGLIVEPGPLHMPHQFDDRIAALLPVRLSPNMPGRMPKDVPSFHIELAPAGESDAVMRLFADAAANKNAWTQMAPYYWCAAAEKASPGATVLAWNPIDSPAGVKTPLIAQSYVGQGQVLFIGTDSTWLWRQNVGDRFFYTFWGQAVRAVARIDKTARKKTWLRVKNFPVQVGEPAQVEMMAFAGDGTPRTDPTLTVQTQSGDDVGAVEMTADPNGKGRYTGNFTPKSAGEYRLSYAPDAGAPAETTLPVTAATDELRRPNIDRAALEQLAADSHGKMIELSDLAALDQELKEPPAEPPKSEAAEVPRPNGWDEGLLAVVVVVLYSLDVGLRRLRGLS